VRRRQPRVSVKGAQAHSLHAFVGEDHGSRPFKAFSKEPASRPRHSADRLLLMLNGREAPGESSIISSAMFTVNRQSDY
jgi:hypothetical protein